MTERRLSVPKAGRCSESFARLFHDGLMSLFALILTNSAHSDWHCLIDGA